MDPVKFSTLVFFLTLGIFSPTIKGGLTNSVIVGSNVRFLRSLSAWLNNLSQWRRCWRASVDGWGAGTFHAQCDNRGPTVTIIRVAGRYIFGGYTKLSWTSSNSYRYDSTAFLFSLVNTRGWVPVRLTQTGRFSSSNAHSIYDNLSYGPTFGGKHDIYIASDAAFSDSSFTDLGYTYGPPSGSSFGSSFAQTFLAGSYHFTPDEVETFYKTT